MMDKRTTDIVAYLTYVGLLFAFAAGDRQASKFHLNQSLVIWLAGTIFSLIGKIPLIGWICASIGGLFCAVCWFIGIVNAFQGVEREVPVLGQIKLLH